jgi:Tol biopolymer transport system component
MPELEEVFRMATQKVRQDSGALERQVAKQKRAARNRRVGALATVVVFATLALVAYSLTRGGTPGGPATRPTLSIPRGIGASMVDLSTGRSTLLPASIASSGASYYAVSPDHTKLAYSACCNPPDPLFLANVDGTQVRQVTPAGQDAFGAQWSPDGSRLVYQRRDASTQKLGNLFVIDLATGHQTQITHFDQTRSWDWWFTFPSFASDGRSILYQLPRGHLPNHLNRAWDLWSVPVTSGQPSIVRRDAGWGAYSPDGSAFAYLSPVNPKDFTGRRLWITIFEGRGPQALAPAGAGLSWPRWSWDGKQISYASGGSIYVSSVDGSTRKVAAGRTAEWLDDHTLIVGPGGG